MRSYKHMPSPGSLARAACALEATAPKAGNVHPYASFPDATWQDFIASGDAIAPVMDRAASLGVGRTVLESVRATRARVACNTNLGIILLLAPLCAVPANESLRRGVRRVLASLTPRDASLLYQAIREVKPGGLGRVKRGDVRDKAPTQRPLGLVEAMSLAADRDAVARQYANGFTDVLNVIAPRLVASLRTGITLEDAIVLTHLQLMADEPDSLIRRKAGDAVARESQHRAAAVVRAGWPHTQRSHRLFQSLDRWLRVRRAGKHIRNPGTSADLITAGLYAALRESMLR